MSIRRLHPAWQIEGRAVRQQDLDGAYGFLYQITHIESGKRYIGIKSVVSGSDWKSYWGSSKTLNAALNILGEDGFRREILEICYLKSDLRQIERKKLFGIKDWSKYYNRQACLKYYGKKAPRKNRKKT